MPNWMLTSAVCADPVLSAVETVPEDVLAEHDLEARLGSEEARQQLAEGSPPADEEPRL